MARARWTSVDTKRLPLPMALVALLATVPAAEGATRYAEPDGNGPAATCPLSDPCDLSTAVESPSVNDGDEVVVLPGRHQLPGDDPSDGFAGNNPLNVFRSIEIHGPPGGPLPTIVEGPDGGAVFLDEAGAELADVEIEGSLGLTTGVAERVRVHQQDATACYFDRYQATGDPGPLIRDSTCWAEDVGPVAALGVLGVADADPPGPDPPIDLAGRLVNVTAYGELAISVGARYGANASLVARNVIATASGLDRTDVGAYTDAGPTIPAGGSATVSLSNSNYDRISTDGPGASVTAPGMAGNQTPAPVLANPLAGDFRQIVASPTIDGGGADPLLGEFDFERQARVQGPAPDIGADEGSIASPFALSAAARRRLGGLGVALRCELVRCVIRVGGMVRAHGGSDRPSASGRAARRFELRTKEVVLAQGERRRARLKLEADARRALAKLLRRGAKAKAAVTADSGEGGFRERARIRIKAPSS